MALSLGVPAFAADVFEPEAPMAPVEEEVPAAPAEEEPDEPASVRWRDRRTNRRLWQRTPATAG